MLKELGLFDQADQYVISYNGAAIVENHGNRVIATQDMPVSLAADSCCGLFEQPN